MVAAGPDDAGLVDFEIRAACQKFSQRDPRLHPRCRRAQASVHALAERHDVARLPLHVQLAGEKLGRARSSGIVAPLPDEVGAAEGAGASHRPVAAVDVDRRRCVQRS
jgi:hypothetical protein